MIYGDLKIVDDSVFYQIVSSDIKKGVQKNLGQITKRVQAKVSQIIANALQNSPTVKSLLSGSLRDDFGLYGNVAKTTLTNIVNYFAENIDLKVQGGSKNTPSTININVIPSSFESVAQLPVGYFLSSKGRLVPWLDWLLTSGTQVVISDFWMYEPARGKTRSGGPKVMIKIGKNSRNPFRVDPAHAGTLDDNFITRALEPVADDIITVVATEFAGGI